VKLAPRAYGLRRRGVVLEHRPAHHHLTQSRRSR
jgi:hypothetical protein